MQQTWETAAAEHLNIVLIWKEKHFLRRQITSFMRDLSHIIMIYFIKKRE